MIKKLPDKGSVFYLTTVVEAPYWNNGTNYSSSYSNSHSSQSLLQSCSSKLNKSLGLIPLNQSGDRGKGAKYKRKNWNFPDFGLEAPPPPARMFRKIHPNLFQLLTPLGAFLTDLQRGKRGVDGGGEGDVKKVIFFCISGQIRPIDFSVFLLTFLSD